MEIIELTKKLIKFESTSYNELALARYVANWLEERGTPVVIDTFNPTHFLNDGENRPDTANVYVTIGNGPQTLLLYAHMDVVKAPAKMFESQVMNERLIGRGTADMKSSLAGLMLAAIACRQAIAESNKRVTFAFIADEETSGTGARRHIEYLSQQHIGQSDLWCILTEPTDGFDYVEVGGKGYIFVDLFGDLDTLISTLQAILRSREEIISHYPSNDPRFGPVLINVTTIACDTDITTKRQIIELGRSAHASRPHEGDNALEKMLHHLTEPVANIWTNHNSPNTIPNRCIAYLAETSSKTHARATIDIRTNPTSDYNDALWADFQLLLDQQSREIRYFVRDRGRAFLLPASGSGLPDICQRCKTPEPQARIAEGGSDAGYYALITPNVIGGFGPGEYSQLHTDTESISLTALQRTSDTFESLIRLFLQLDMK